jgi:YD repeat-containing protein
MNNKPDWLIEHEITLEGQKITYSYDKEGDILEIFFRKGGGVGIDLTDNIVLRYDHESEEALSLILISFSHLIQPTKFGPPSFRLTALRELPADMQQTVLGILSSFPVNRFLKVSGLLSFPDGELQPITYLEQPNGFLLDKIPA